MVAQGLYGYAELYAYSFLLLLCFLVYYFLIRKLKRKYKITLFVITILSLTYLFTGWHLQKRIIDELINHQLYFCKDAIIEADVNNDILKFNLKDLPEWEVDLADEIDGYRNILSEKYGTDLSNLYIHFIPNDRLYCLYLLFYPFYTVDMGHGEKGGKDGFGPHLSSIFIELYVPNECECCPSRLIIWNDDSNFQNSATGARIRKFCQKHNLIIRDRSWVLQYIDFCKTYNSTDCEITKYENDNAPKRKDMIIIPQE